MWSCRKLLLLPPLVSPPKREEESKRLVLRLLLPQKLLQRRVSWHKIVKEKEIETLVAAVAVASNRQRCGISRSVLSLLHSAQTKPGFESQRHQQGTSMDSKNHTQKYCLIPGSVLP